MNAKISVIVICVEAIIYLLLYNLHDCTFNFDDNDDAIETEDEPMYCPDRNELLQIIDTKQKFSLFSKDGGIVQSYANNAARITDHHFVEKSRQTAIRDYFQSDICKI